MTVGLSSFRHLGIISRNPLIVMTCLDSFDPYAENLAHLMRSAISQPFVLLVQVWKSLEYQADTNPVQIQQMLHLLHDSVCADGANEIVILCNTPREVSICEQNKCRAIFINHNCFVNENIFFPLPTIRRFDAIYNAQMWDVKRHELAIKIKSLSLVYALHLGDRALERLRLVTQLMPTVHLVNGNPLDADQAFSYLSAAEVNAAYNQARVGVCLSAVEGAMFSSVEYLLSGLPVVTTINQGGRDIFFREQYCRWTEDDPREIARSVERLIDKNIDPFYIRRSTLALLQVHRDRFRSLVIDLAFELQVATDGEDIFPRVLFAPFGMPIKSVASLLIELQLLREEPQAVNKLDHTAGLSIAEVVFAYQLVHNRNPESDAIIEYIRSKCADTNALREVLFNSEEFQRGF